MEGFTLHVLQGVKIEIEFDDFDKFETFGCFQFQIKYEERGLMT